MAKRILSISYDESLLATRQLILTRVGYDVKSALGFVQAQEVCRDGSFDLIILGHSIPRRDKSAVVSLIKSSCGSAAVLSLVKATESPIPEANSFTYDLDPDSLLKAVCNAIGEP